MKKSQSILTRYNHFCGAIWAAVREARRSSRKHFYVVRKPGQKRWLIADQQFVKSRPYKSFFNVKSYRGHAAHRRACLNAHKAIDAWRAAIFRELARTGNLQCIPRPSGAHDRENLLQMAACKNKPRVIALLIQAGTWVDHDAGKGLRIAVGQDNRAAVIALLHAGASISVTRFLIRAQPVNGIPRRWTAFFARLTGIIKEADLDENLPIFDELADLAREPVLRPIIAELATQYPSLWARLL